MRDQGNTISIPVILLSNPLLRALRGRASVSLWLPFNLMRNFEDTALEALHLLAAEHVLVAAHAAGEDAVGAGLEHVAEALGPLAVEDLEEALRP